MAYPALALAVLAAVLAVSPGDALFVAMGLSLVALVLGVASYRDRRATSGRRIWGAAAGGLGGLALAFCVLRYGLILAAIDRLEALVG